jgi:hypothetical protein
VAVTNLSVLGFGSSGLGLDGGSASDGDFFFVFFCFDLEI